MKTALLLLAMLVSISFSAIAEEAPVACPMIAKLCPDGSSVSPQGPKCKMAACPSDGDKDLQGPEEENCNGDDCDDDKKTDEQND